MTIQLQVFEPNELQLKAYTAFEEAKELDKKRCVIQLPPGAGKTYLAATIVVNVLKENKNLKFLFMTDRRDILEQASEKHFKNYIKNKNISFGYYHGDKKDTDKTIIFATLQSLRNNLNDFSQLAFDYIFYDEAQRALAPTYSKVINHFKPKMFIALTATPQLANNISISPFCGEIIVKSNIFDGISSGVLCPLKYYKARECLDFEKAWNGKRYDKEIFNLEFCKPQYDKAILNGYKEFCVSTHKRKKTIIFCYTIEHAYRLSNVFEKDGIKNIVWVSKDKNNRIIPIEKRDNIVKKFKNNEVDVMFVRDLANEGLDEPNTDCGLFIRPTKSRVLETQRIGRLLRKSVDKEYALAINFQQYSKNSLETLLALDDIFNIDLKTKMIKHYQEHQNDKQDLIIDTKHFHIRLSFDEIAFYTREYFLKNINENNIDDSVLKQRNSFNTFIATKTKLDVNCVISKNELYAHYKNFCKEQNFIPDSDQLFSKKLLKNCNVVTYKAVLKNKKRVNCWRGIKSKRPDISESKLQQFRNIEKLEICDISLITGVPETSIRQYLSKYKILKFADNKLTNDIIIKELANGLDDKSIADKYNYKEITVKSMLCKMGLGPRGRYKNHESTKNSTVAFNDDYKVLNEVEKLKITKNSRGKKPFKTNTWTQGYVSTSEKLSMRYYVATLVQNWMTILCLESPKAEFLEELIKQGKTGIRLIIPNHQEYEALKASCMKYDGILNIELYPVSVGQFLKDTNEQFDLIWLDYCGAFHHYKQDLDCMFKNLKEKTTLVLTYSTFSPLKDTEFNYYVEVMDYLIKHLQENYYVECIENLSKAYKKGMYSIGVIITKRKGLNSLNG